MIVFGPVPSRRLGQCIGINNIPPKACSYSCVYCQVGRTNRMQITRSEFYRPDAIYCEAEAKIRQLDSLGEHVDYISFVPDGEPTLDKNLGVEIELLKQLKRKIAVITNASLLWLDDVKRDLLQADWISVKLETVDESIWKKIDRPHGRLELKRILAGINDFSKVYKGTLVTETMLIDDVNDSAQCIEEIGRQLAIIQPAKAYLLVPTRPPAESGVKRSSGNIVAEAANSIRNSSGVSVECITGDENSEGFFVSGDNVSEFLSIVAVHPVREDVVEDLLRKRKLNKTILAKLINQGVLIEFYYEGKKFYRKNLINA